MIEALAAIGLATGVTRSAVVYTFVSAGHIFGIALLVGPIVLVDLALLGLVRSLDAAAFDLLRRTAKIGVVLAIVTGFLLLTARPADYADNSVLWAKLVVLVLAIANALVFERRLRGTAGGVAFPSHARAHAAASLALWLSVLVLGRWIAFV